MTTTYETGSAVPVNGYYICVPCGYKRYFKAGSRFSDCLKCLEQEPDLVITAQGLWEKFED